MSGNEMKIFRNCAFAKSALLLRQCDEESKNVSITNSIHFEDFYYLFEALDEK